MVRRRRGCRRIHCEETLAILNRIRCLGSGMWVLRALLTTIVRIPVSILRIPLTIVAHFAGDEVGACVERERSSMASCKFALGSRR